MMSFAKALEFNIFVLKAIGAWPMFDRTKNIAYIIFVIVIYFTPFTILPVISIYMDGHKDLVNITKNTFIPFEVLFIPLKIISLYRNHDKLKEVVEFWDTVENKFKLVRSRKQEKIVEETIKFAVKIYWYYTGFCLLAVVVFATKPLQYDHKTLPLDAWLPFDPFSNVFVYAFVVIYQIIWAFMSASTASCIVTLMANLMLFATAQINILKESLKHLGGSENGELEEVEEANGNKDNDALYKNLSECVQHHIAIIQFVRTVEATFTFSVLIQFIGSIIVICFSTFVMTVLPIFSIDFAALFTFLVCMLLELFLFCYFGTNLHFESSTLTEAIYLGNWRNYDLKTKRGLLTLMERAKKPLVVTAGGVFKLSLETFTTILRRAYSFFAVLRNMDIDIRRDAPINIE